jgi:hypothetical protein
MEFDGFMHTDFSLTATEDIAEVVLEIPFRPEWATLVNYMEYHPHYNGVFPERLEHPYVHPTPVWVGSEIGGTQFIINTWHGGEHDFKNHRLLRDKTPGLILEKKDGAHCMTVVLANETVKKGDTFSTQFAFITTPVKPIKTDRIVGHHWRYHPAYSPYWNIAEHEMDPSHSVGSLIRTTEEPGGPMTNYGTYITIGRLRDNSPDIQYWADDFMKYPRRRRVDFSFGRSLYRASVASESYRDYYVYWVAAKQARRRRVAGSYYDADVCAGGASYLEGRTLAKRIYLAFLESERETATQFHQSGMWFGGWQFSFNDSHLDGENFVSVLTKAKPGYHNYYRTDAFRAQLSSYQFGIQCNTLDQFSRAGVIPATEEAWAKWGSHPCDFFMGLCYLHYDVHPSASYAYQPFVKKWTDAAATYGLLASRIPEDTYFPYWAEDIAPFPEGVYGSFYRLAPARRTILIAVNYNEKEMTMTLPIDLDTLGYKADEPLKIIDAVIPQKAVGDTSARAKPAVRGDRLTFSIGPAGASMIVIEPGQQD